MKIKHTNISYAEKKLHEAFPIYGSCLCGLREMSKLRTVYLTFTALPSPLSLPVSTSTASHFIQLHQSPDSASLSSSLLSQLESATHNMVASATIDRSVGGREDMLPSLLQPTANHICAQLVVSLVLPEDKLTYHR